MRSYLFHSLALGSWDENTEFKTFKYHGSGNRSCQASHQAVAIAYPEVVLLNCRFENNYEAISFFDEKVMKIAKRNNLRLIYGLEDSGAYGSYQRGSYLSI